MHINRLIVLILMLGLTAGCVTVDPQQTNDEAASNVNTELAWGYLQQRDFETANAKLKKALGYNPKNARANYLYGVLQEELGQKEQAEKYYKLATRLDPKNSNAAYVYGRFLCRNQREAESEQYFLSAVKDPFYKVPELSLTSAAICMMQIKEYQKAEKHLGRVLADKGNYPPALFNMAKLKFELGNFEQADLFIDQYHRLAKATAETLWLAIRTELELDADSDVSELAQRLGTEFPDSQEYQDWLNIQ